MKLINLLLLLFLLAGTGVAQSTTATADASGVKAEAKGWRQDVRNPMLEDDPLRPNNEQLELERARRQNQEENARRERLGIPAQPPPTPVPAIDTTPRAGTTVEYIYTVKVTNTGTKPVSKLVWEYVFFEPGTEKEVGRRRSESKVSLRPGQSKTLVARSGLPPTGTIDASQAGKKERPKYSEQIVIQSVEYADGTTWQRDKN